MNRRKLKGMNENSQYLLLMYYLQNIKVKHSQNYLTRYLRLVECLSEKTYEKVMQEFLQITPHRNRHLSYYKSLLKTVWIIRTDKSKWRGSK